MKYLEMKLHINKEDLERAEAVLIGSGFNEMLIDDPEDAVDIIKHPDIYKYDYINEDIRENLQRKPTITLYFPDDSHGEAAYDRVLDILEDAGIYAKTECRVTGEDSDWLYNWQENFKPTRIGERIVVKPSWEDYSPEPQDLVVEMDPGMAFGSGLHETTSMCIKALEKILLSGQAGDIKVLDVGTGTGILSLAAALLGADECLGIDIDNDAVEIAKQNIANNNLSDRIEVRCGDLTEGVDYKADVVVANLMADLVIRLTPAAFGHLNEDGWYITSGILDTKEDVVSKAIQDAGFTIEDVLSDGEWRAIVARRRVLDSL